MATFTWITSGDQQEQYWRANIHNRCVPGVSFWTSSDLVLCEMSINSRNRVNELPGCIFQFSLTVNE